MITNLQDIPLEFDLIQGSKIYADKAYTDYLLQETLHQSLGIHLISRRKENAKRRNSSFDEFHLSLKRNRIETCFSSIVSMMPRCIRAVTAKGFCLKIFFFIFGYMIKHLLPNV